MKEIIKPLPRGVLHLNGVLGKALDKTIEGRLKKVDYKKLTDVFRYRTETDNAWRCEFFGKILRSVIFAWRSTQDPELKKILDHSIQAILEAQTPDGIISSYPHDLQLKGWDIWGRKYVLLTLLEYYDEVDPRPEILLAAARHADALLRQTNGKIQNYGEHQGMAASSILRGLVRLYRATGEKHHLDAARTLAQAGCCWTHDIFKAAWNGFLPSELANGKSYEMTSCFQGIVELYKVTQDPFFLESAVRYFEAVRDHEIFITGSGGLKDCMGELWYNGKSRQMRQDCGGIGETCVTVTWLAYCRCIHELTGNSSPADEMERAFYNALLGSISQDGSNFIHTNPMLTGGAKILSTDQIGVITGSPYDGHDCCRAQGPYGLSLAPMIAVMATEHGYAVNLYEDLEAQNILKIEGGYPANSSVQITVLQEGDFELALRIPADFACKVDGKGVSSGYHRLRHDWKSGEKVLLDFDFTERTILSPCKQWKAFQCGPVVMAEDHRTGNPPEEILHRSGNRMDYATAGNLFSVDNTLRVWFPIKEL
ncbi:MAG: beta-L-arabinofuranosidase domain-containing protein [Lentisphaeria bacterium]